MATAQQIVDAIIKRVENSKSPNYKSWRIGLTHDPNERYTHWDKPEFFLYWEASSLPDAQAVELYFIKEMEMQGGTGGNLHTEKITYVYIF